MTTPQEIVFLNRIVEPPRAPLTPMAPPVPPVAPTDGIRPLTTHTPEDVDVNNDAKKKKKLIKLIKGIGCCVDVLD